MVASVMASGTIQTRSIYKNPRLFPFLGVFFLVGQDPNC